MRPESPDALRGQSAGAVLRPPSTDPTYPEWCVDEDWERVWVRLDAVDRADELCSPVLIERDHGLGSVLVEAQTIPLWLDRVDTEWSEGWLLKEVELSSDEAVLYVEYEVCDAD